MDFLHCASQKEGRKNTLKGEGVQVLGPWPSRSLAGKFSPSAEGPVGIFGKPDGLVTWVGSLGYDPRLSLLFFDDPATTSSLAEAKRATAEDLRLGKNLNPGLVHLNVPSIPGTLVGLGATADRAPQSLRGTPLLLS